MTEQVQDPQQQTQEDEVLQEAQDFFGQSMGRIKGQMQSDSAQLEGMMAQLPEESQAQIQEMTDSYSQFEDTIDQAVQDAGVQDATEEAAQQSKQSADEASGQGEELADQAQEAVGGVADQAQETAGGLPTKRKRQPVESRTRRRKRSARPLTRPARWRSNSPRASRLRVSPPPTRRATPSCKARTLKGTSRPSSAAKTIRETSWTPPTTSRAT